jgi:uncharacterized protein YgiM (DUF1202 family)
MPTILSSRIQSTVFICTIVLMAVTCTCISISEANTVDDTTRITIPKGKFINPAEMIGVLQPISTLKDVEPAETTPHMPMDSVQVLKTDNARINSKESLYIGVMSAPSENSRTIALVKSGQTIKVLKVKDNWMKITWQTDNTLNQGWLKKSYIEGKTIHAHR